MAAPPDYRAIAQHIAVKYGIDPGIFLRQIGQESGFDPNARSSAGAVGIAQFMPGTAASYHINPLNPLQSLDAAARYDKSELQAFGGDWHRALAAYNAGAGNADKWNDPNFAGGQTFRYVRSILGGTNPQAAGGATASARVAPRPVAAGGGQGSPIAAALRLLGFQAPAAPKPIAAPTMQPPQPQASAPVSTGVLGQVQGSTGGEQARFLRALAQLAGYEHAPVQINSGFRSYAHQAQLYANRASNPNPVARPGHSLHEQGLAADGTVKDIPLGLLPDAVLARFGLQKVPGDPVHVQIAR